MRRRADPHNRRWATLQCRGLGAVAIITLFTREQIYRHRMAKYPKLFPISKVEFQPNSTIKLTKKKIELITQKQEAQESSGEIAKSHHIT